eukprot:9421762-Lingulodinium_polyedra.AAC.1
MKAAKINFVVPSSKPQAAAAGSGRSQASVQKLPEHFTTELLKQWLPRVKGCYPFVDHSAARARCFYSRPGKPRDSFSASLSKWGEHKTMLLLLSWAWKVHTECTGEQPHFELPAMDE